MKYFETEKVELKRNLNETFEKEVVAFLNTHDGVVYIGIEDNGIICGVEKIDENIVSSYDLVVITTAHTNVDYDMVAKNAKVVFDTKNAMKKVEFRDNIELL